MVRSELQHTLNENQLKAFLRESKDTQKEVMDRIVNEIVHYSEQRTCEKFRLLDLGGGDGKILDKCLDRIKNSEGILIENSSFMLSQNQHRTNKKLINGDILTLSDSLKEKDRFDLIMLNVVLHHCVSSDLKLTRQIQCGVLKEAQKLLKEKGSIFVVEVIIHPYSWSKNWVTGLIYKLTSLKVFAPIFKVFGANSAGTGVLYSTEKEISSLFDSSFLEIAATSEIHQNPRKLRDHILGCQKITENIFFLSKREDVGI